MRGAGASAWLTRREDGVRCRVKVTPRAAKTDVKGIEVGAGGEAYLAVRVTAAPEGGRANAALVDFLARRWRLAARALEVVSGGTARRKVLHVAGPADELFARLTDIERAG